MGVELGASHPRFAAALDEVCAEMDPLLGRPVRALLSEVDGELDRTEFTQAALFAVEVALYRLVESLGIKPDYLMGHSIGELVAAHVAGVLSLPDACALVVARGRLMGALPPGGGMVAVQADEEEVVQSLSSYTDRLSVAALNGPRSVVVSGDLAALDEWLPQWAEKGRKTTRLRVSHAFHSHRMEPMLAEFRRVAEQLTYHEPRIAIVSNVSGKIESDELTDPGYWVEHVRRAVRFVDGIRVLHGEGVRQFLELGPDAVLTALGRLTLDEDDAVFAPALRARTSEATSFAGFLGAAHVAGVPVDWSAVYAGSGARRVPLPTYAFQRERYWVSPGTGSGDPVAVGLGLVDHPLLAAAIQVGDRDEWVFTGRLSQDAAPWLRDHAVFSTVLMPGAALVELALAAGARTGAPALEEFLLEAPLAVPADAALQLQVTVAPADGDGRREVAVYARPEDGESEATRHAHGTLTPVVGPTVQFPVAWPPPGAQPVPVDTLYHRLADSGYDYGPLFRGLRAAWRDGDTVYTELALPEDVGGDGRGYGVHPVLLDAALHGALLGKDGDSPVELPYSWSGVRLGSGGGPGCGSASTRRADLRRGSPWSTEPAHRWSRSTHWRCGLSTPPSSTVAGAEPACSTPSTGPRSRPVRPRVRCGSSASASWRRRSSSPTWPRWSARSLRAPRRPMWCSLPSLTRTGRPGRPRPSGRSRSAPCRCCSSGWPQTGWPVRGSSS